MPTQHLIDFDESADDEAMLKKMGLIQPKTEESPEQKMTQMLYAIAAMGGEATIPMVVDAGYRWPTIAAALEKPTDDGRKKPPLAAHVIGDLTVLTLTSQGWQRVGKTGMRERKPNAANITHRLLPGKIVSHIQNTIGKSERWQRTCRVTAENSHEAILDWQNGLVAKAWGELNSRSDAGGEVGVMTTVQGTPRPDLIILEEWWKAPETRPWTAPGDSLWQTAMGTAEITLPEVFTILVEVETSHKNNTNLLAKVKRLNTAMRLRAAHAVVWVTDDESIAARVQQFIAREGGNGDGSHAYATVAEMTGDNEKGMGTILPERCRPYWVPGAIHRLEQSTYYPPGTFG